MSSRTFRLFLLAFPASLATIVGCGYSGVVAPPSVEQSTEDAAIPPDGAAVGATGAPDGGVTADEVAQAQTDGGLTPTVMPYEGSPLCNASTAAGCYPDVPTLARACPIDSGVLALAPEIADASVACRVTADPAGSNAQPMCAPSGDAVAGATCTGSNDCAPGLDCVSGGAGGTPICAQYCCMGNPACQSNQFCDVQPVAFSIGMATKVPVCMPLHHCELLGTSTLNCPATQTCSVVREDGATSCVGIGTAKAGEPCETVHCAAGLACLGVPGNRACFQLCHTTSMAPNTECGPNQVCRGGAPLFTAAYGICVN
jgi:hypothetical protein